MTFTPVPTGQVGVIATPIPPVPGAGELIIICAAIGGAGLGFLWFNTYPAMVFMGDIGALALGAVLGAIAAVSYTHLTLPTIYPV